MISWSEALFLALVRPSFLPQGDVGWRPPELSRRYYRLVLVDGRQLTVYRDLIRKGWWLQRA